MFHHTLQTFAVHHTPKLLFVWRSLRRFVRKQWLRGAGVSCPLCGHSFRAWLAGDPFGECPDCGSWSRQRILALLLARYALNGKRVLIFSPDLGMDCWLRRAADRVVAVDFHTRYGFAVDVLADACYLPFADESFDLVLSSHILEHIRDDRSAMREMARVLKPGGRALVQVPLAQDRIETDEDPSVTEPRERKRRFGQHDHLRLYGMDIEYRLRQCGFDQQTYRMVRELPSDLALRYGIFDDPIFICMPHTPEEACFTRQGDPDFELRP